MQTTLLGLAITIILALVAALVGPLLIDWGAHRSLFEAQASRLIGLNVRVTGEIDARLLPSPRLTLHDIEIGDGAGKIRARDLGIELALGPLMRGQWRATELHLAGPQLKLGLDASGHLHAPQLAIRFNPDALSIDRLSVEDGKVTLADAASGASITLDKFWFNGQARSLLGPFKGEGAAAVGGELYPFRIAAGRYGDNGAIRLHVNVDPVNQPLSIEADGALELAGGQPRFDGNLNLRRPVGIRARGATQLTQPWHLSGKFKANPAKALMEQFDFQYGSEDQAVKLSGVADLKFGKHPRFDGVISAQQIDLDRAFAAGDATRPAPAAAMRQFAELAGGAFRPPIPIKIGIGVDQVTLGGDTVANLRGDISTDATGWNLDRFEFRAPGFTQVRLSGHLAVDGDNASFTGPADVQAGDPKALAAWLQGGAAAKQADHARPLTLRGEVTLGSDKLAIENLNAEFDRKTIAGRFVYTFAAKDRPAKLDAALTTPELDVDAAFGFGKAMLAGSKLERPRDMTIAVDIGRATGAGIEARNASARLTVNAGGLRIDRLSVADLGGGAFSASGRIDTSGSAPRGALALDFEARQTAAIAALVTKFAPASVSSFGGLLERATHAKLHAALDVAGDKDKSATIAKLAITGDVDAMRVDVQTRVTGDWAKRSAADVRLDGTVEAPDGATLVKLLGLDQFVAVGKGAGQFKFLIEGPADQDLSVNLGLRAGDLWVQSIGKGRISLADGIKLTSRLRVAQADLRLLRTSADAALPVSLTTRLAVAGRSVTFNDIDAKLGGSTVRGRLAFAGVAPVRIDGALETDTVEVAPLIAGAIGMPASASRDGTWNWSSEPFGAGVFGAYGGQVTLKARRVALLPRLTGRAFSATLRIGKDEFVLDDMTADLAGGHLSGQISFHAADDGLTARAKIALKSVDVAGLLASGARPAVTGSLNLSGELEGTGLSPVALIGSLRGSGKAALSNAQFASLDPRAFDTVTQAVDRGLPVDAGRISDVVGKALDSGALSVKRAEGTIALSAGQARLGNVTAECEGAGLSLSGNLDLADGTIDARLVLSGSSKAAGTRPDIFMALKGPVAQPSRSIDVSALTGWLTLRAIENQANQLQTIQSAAPPPPQANAVPAKPNVQAPNVQAPRARTVPPLSPPINIAPLPAPGGIVLPEASVHPQN